MSRSSSIAGIVALIVVGCSGPDGESPRSVAAPGAGGAGQAGATMETGGVAGAMSGGEAGAPAAAGAGAAGGGMAGANEAGVSGAGGAAGQPPLQGPPTTCEQANGDVGCCSPDLTTVYRWILGQEMVSSFVCAGGTRCGLAPDRNNPSCLDAGAEDEFRPPPICGAPTNPYATMCPVPCTTDADCTSVASERPVCHPEFQLCVECLSSEHCAETPGRPVCKISYCVQCLSNADCAQNPKGLFACDPYGNKCVVCHEDADCGSPTARCLALALPHPECLECAGQYGTPYCPCTSDDQCPTGPKKCDVDSGQCATCATDADCFVTAPRCSAAGFCEKCTSDLDCAAHAGDPRCNTCEGACGECVTDADCNDPAAPFCHARTCAAPVLCDTAFQPGNGNPGCNECFAAAGCCAEVQACAASMVCGNAATPDACEIMETCLYKGCPDANCFGLP